MIRTYDWPGRVTCLKVLDGDTIRAEFDLGFDLKKIERRLRFGGINADEISSSDPAKRALARAAKARVEALLPPGTVFGARTDKDMEKYGGYLGRLTLPDGTDLNDLLVAEGLAWPYGGGRR